MPVGEPSREVKLFGTEEPVPESIVLKAGPLSLEFGDGWIRNLRIGGVEVIRGISFLVRDSAWGTIRGQIDRLTIDLANGGFRVSFRCLHQDGDCDLAYSALLSGERHGRMKFEVTARVHRDFHTNRTGLVVLHPSGTCAGAPVKVSHVDGSTTVSAFPTLISPVPPFSAIRAVSCESPPGLWTTCILRGDEFEMEDQRNFSDASFKTYSRPASLPRPYWLRAGEQIRQSAEVHFQGPVPPIQDTGGVVVSVGPDQAKLMPAVGLGLSAAHLEYDPGLLEPLKRLVPGFLVCELDLNKGQGIGELVRYRNVCRAVGSPAHLEVVLDEDTGLEPLAAMVAGSGLNPAALSVFPAGRHSAEVVKSFFPCAQVGGGTNQYFLHLARNPPDPEVDFLTQTTCAVVHTADDRSVMQTLESLPVIAASTRALLPGKPLHMGPSNIGMRRHPHAPHCCPNPLQSRIVMTAEDPRQRGLFAAAWATGYVAAMVQAGVSAVGLFSPWGPFGVIHRRAEYPQAWYDHVDARVRPAYHVIAGLAGLSGHPMCAASSSCPERAACLCCSRAGQKDLWLANLSGEQLEVALEGVDRPASLALLDETLFVQAVTDSENVLSITRPMQDVSRAILSPYAVARICWTGAPAS